MRKALYILGDLLEGDIRWLVEAGTKRNVAPGETIIAAHSPLEALFVIVDGEFAVTIDSGATIARLGAGDILGEMSLVEKRPPSVSVSALSPSRVLAVPQAALRARIESDTGFAARFYRALSVFLSDRLRSTVSQLGYGATGQDDMGTSFEDENEMDEVVLDTLHVAGNRMRYLIAMLEQGGN